MQVDKPAIEISTRVSTLLASSAALPRREDLGVYLADFARAEARGYFLPDEDERLRTIYSRYLAVRSALWALLDDVSRGEVRREGTNDLREFAVAYAAASLLVRAASYLIELTENAPLTRKKLDEPEPRYHLEAKTFTRIFESLTAPKRWWAYFDAVRFYEKNKSEILALRDDPEVLPVIDLIETETGVIDLRKDELLKRRLGYRLHSFFRRSYSGYKKVMFGLVRMSGSQIAEMKQPFVKPSGAGKRVDAEVRERLEKFLQPGDVLVTRHDDAVSNLFLPGFWPHAGLHIGRNEQRAELGLDPAGIDADVRFLESKRDGVLLRASTDTLQVDTVVVLRPLLTREEVTEALTKALSHVGKLYDFIFDFGASDRLACTELIYRAYHRVGPIAFELVPHAGRPCLSAEDLLNQCVANGWFEPVLIFGLGGDDWIEGPEARSVLRDSFASAFE